MKRADLSDRLLAYLVFGAGVVLVTHFTLLPGLPGAWKKPGGFPLYTFGVVGTLLLLVSVVFLFVKRTGRGGSPVAWFSAHVVTASVGGVLVAIHSAGYLRYAPGLLLLVLAGLAALGVWARIRLSHRMSAVFASHYPSFMPLGPGRKERLRAIIEEKERLLADLDPGAREGTFSLTLAHWVRRPRRSWAFARLVRRESAVLGARQTAGFAHAYWRRAHIALAALFLAGVLGHIVVVTFFAGYVSGGGEIYWWHLAEW